MPFSNGRNLELRVYFGDGDVNTYYVGFIRGRDGPWDGQPERNPIELRLARKIGAAGTDADMIMIRRETPTFTPADPSYSTFYYRLERQGGVLTAMWSPDGTTWTTGFSEDLGAQLDGLNQRVVLTGGSWFSPAGSYADYDYIKLATLNTPPVVTVSDATREGDARGGWVFSADGIASAGDAEDGALQVSCAPELGTVLPLGQTQVSCTATDSGGLSATASGVVTVVDSAPPSIACPADVQGTVGAAVVLGAPTVADMVDGAPAITNNAPGAFGAGTTTVTWRAADASGNSATCAQKVGLTYVFQGFYQPVDNLPTLNVAKAGQAIALKWSLQDAGGNSLGDPAAVASYGYSTLASCGGGGDAVEEYASAGSTSLRYDATAKQFILTSKTDKAWAGTCKVFTLVLADGTRHQAKFSFTR